MKKCKIKSCDKKHQAKGFCQMHYTRLQRHGDPLTRLYGKGLSFIEKTVKKAKKKKIKKCIEWPYSKTSEGYGKVQPKGRSVYAHRHALTLFTSKNPKHKLACHGVCHNRACVNPHHLSWQTPKKNVRDMERDGTKQQGERHYRAKLTEAAVLEIRNTKGWTHQDLADWFGVSQTHISGIIRRVYWTHI